MRTLTTALLASSLLVASLIACGGGDTPPANNPTTPPASASAATSATPPASATPGPTASATPGPEKPAPAKEPETAKFDSLPKDKKVEIMSTKVVPNLGKDFKEYDGKRFANFGCATCHGPKKNEDPHKVLPKITLSNGGWEKMQKNKPELAKFMSEKVLPDMAAALGEKPMDPATHQGFGCGGCHEVK